MTRCNLTTRWLDSDSVVKVTHCRQHGDYITGNSIIVLLAARNSDYTVTVQSSVVTLPSRWLMEYEFAVLFLFIRFDSPSKNFELLKDLFFKKMLIKKKRSTLWSQAKYIHPLTPRTLKPVSSSHGTMKPFFWEKDTICTTAIWMSSDNHMDSWYGPNLNVGRQQQSFEFLVVAAVFKCLTTTKLWNPVVAIFKC